MLVAVAFASGGRRDRGEPGGIGVVMRQQILDVAVVLIVLVEAILTVDLNALKVLFHDEIDDAGDRIGPVGGRGAARHHIDPLHQLGRNLVDVGRRVGVRRARITDAQAPAIDEHQGSLRTESSKVDGRDATRGGQGARLIAEVGVGPDAVLRQRVQHVDGVGITG